MISFLKGDIVEINVDYVLIDVNGVGYQVFVGKPQDFTYGRSLIYTYYQVKEDGVSLFGFKTNVTFHLYSLASSKKLIRHPGKKKEDILEIYLHK